MLEAHPLTYRTHVLPRLLSLVKVVYSTLLRYLLKFGVVGLIGYVVDVGIFNVLWRNDGEGGNFFQGPIGAKIVSVAVATLVNWVGNRYWTFRENRRRNFVLELLEFAIVSVLGLLVGLACLWLSHYVFGLHSRLADNISSNVIGLGLGTVLRFALYRYWVYGLHRKDGLTARQNRVEAATLVLFQDEALVNRETAEEQTSR
ncbi:MAG TPA: GtrA family protein [Lacisediminihabitans sp.]|uniref:GtrA family protein n=1 Tax=Lacisediminihabitans sp. TaxID=2787631 RepID=UPI002EDB2D88